VILREKEKIMGKKNHLDFFDDDDLEGLKAIRDYFEKNKSIRMCNKLYKAHRIIFKSLIEIELLNPAHIFKGIVPKNKDTITDDLIAVIDDVEAELI
jgi:hypothetical protein